MQTVRIFRSDLPDGAVINEKDFDSNLHKIWTKPVEIPEISKEIPDEIPPKKSTRKRGS